ncbi:MAG: ABC transporter ATP-binding protein, partial [Chloroflexi bacterium]
PTAKRVHFHFPPPAPSGRLVLELRGVSKRYGDQVVFRHIQLSIERGERIALVGRNGAGKSTLLKILAGRTDFEGERIVGHNVILDYFAQDQSEVLLPENTVLEELRRDASLETDEELRHLLGAFLFSGDEVYKPVRVLSGGERSRLALAKLLLRGANLLLLDEPTNHLDLDAKEVLLDALQRYEGTLVFVAHDRYFLNALAQKVVEVGQGRVQVYLGDYEHYLWKKKQEEGTGKPLPPKTSSPAVSQAKAERLRAREAARRAAREERRRQRRLEELEQLITSKEAEVESLEEAMSRPGFYAQREAAQAVVDRYRSLKQEIEAHYREWEALATDLGL